jgi:hypothetical protein
MGPMPLTGLIPRQQLLAAAAVGFAAVFALAFAIDDPRQAITVLYVIPIALCALALGSRAGVVAAIVATGLLAIWVVASDVEIGMSGWLARVLTFFIIALLVGRYEQLARRLVRQQAEERAATEVQEGVVQSLVIATYELRRGNTPAAEAAVDEALASAKRIISSRLPEVKPGDLRRPSSDDDPLGP